MLQARVLAGIHAGRDRACALGLLLILVALVPLADASPPDPVWLAGIYDGADFDEVVIAVVAATGLVCAVVSLRPADRASAAVQWARIAMTSTSSILAVHIRAPPS